MNDFPSYDPQLNEERVLVLAPLGRDSVIAVGLLREAGLTAEACTGVEELVEGCQAGIGCAVVTHEAIQTADLHALIEWLRDQPPWSDLPIVVITRRGGGLEWNPGATRFMDALGNATFLERPFHPSTLLSLVQSALRSRRRQYLARAQLMELSTREQSLKSSEERFRTLADNIPVLTWTANPDGWIYWYNKRWYEYTGTTPDQMTGWGWQSVHHPDSLPSVVQKWHLVIATGEPFEMVFPLRRADGVFRPFLTKVVPVKENGKVVRWFGTNVDITEERAAEAAIRASEEKLRLLNETLEQQVTERTAALQASQARLRTIFETSLQAQALLSVDGTILDANATSLALINSSLDSVVGFKFWDAPWFTATPGLPETIRAAVEAAATGENIRQELTLNVLGGSRTLDFSIRPVRDESGKVFAIVPEAADVTTARQAEDALRQAQKMEAIGQLTGGIAHDFNNMLQGIAGGVELMRKRIKSGRPQEAERFVEVARQSLARAAALTHRLLSFSRRQALVPKRVSLDELISGIGGLIRQTVGPAINFKMVLEDGCWPVKCDPNQLENALLNLAINARDAMVPDGGDLQVRTRHVVLKEADLAGWDSARPGEFVEISVTDTGSGMSPDVLEHAFEPFFTTKPAGEGTGLGLSQVFGFISQSHGIVRIASQVDRGTSVRLYLPRHLEPVEDDAAPERLRVSDRSFKSATVLLVEDEADIRQLAAATLRDFGCTVIEAEDGRSGLSVLRHLADLRRASVDILIADIGLPGGLNGRQLADAARELIPDLPVLLITGYAGGALGPGVQLNPGMELLSKPFALEALAARVDTMLSPARSATAGADSTEPDD